MQTDKGFIYHGKGPMELVISGHCKECGEPMIGKVCSNGGCNDTHKLFGPEPCDHCGFPTCGTCGGCLNPVMPTCMCIDARGVMHPEVPNPRITCEESFGGTAA